MSSYYYLNKYGGAGLSANSYGFMQDLPNGEMMHDNFVSSLLEYNKFSTFEDLTFVSKNADNAASGGGLNLNADDSFTAFYNSYKTIIGSDIMSYVNKYTNTNNMALGDMMNFNAPQAGLAGGNQFQDNLVTDPDNFYFHKTYDGQTYRYTHGGTADALKQLGSGTSAPDFPDLDDAYDAYVNYKTAQFDGKTTPVISTVANAFDLTNATGLGIDFAAISAITTSTIGQVAIYQNLIDQLVSEATAIKGSTISKADRITMEKDLDAKQSALNAIDDAIYGHGYTYHLMLDEKITSKDASGLRSTKSLDDTLTPTTDIDSSTAYVPNTDQKSLIYQLASSIEGDITYGSSVSAADKLKVALNLSEQVAAVVERYWVENFNNSNAEPMDHYFAREFRNEIDPSGTSSPIIAIAAGLGIQATASLSKDPAVENIIDKIMQKQAWGQMISKIEDRSRAEVSLFEESTAMDVVQNINTKDYEYRIALLGQLEKLTKSIPALAKLDFSGVTKNLITLGPGQQKNPWWQEYFPWFKGYYGNLPEGATPDQMFDKDGHLTMKYSAPGTPLIDPYVIKINGVDYVMGKDDDKDGNITNAQEILGITDTTDTTFASLKALDTDKNGIISQEELKANNIILKAVNESERMNGSDFDTTLINSIDLSTLTKGDGTNDIYGFFNVKLKNGQTAAAVQTFKNQNYFNNLFGKYADMSFLTGSASNSESSSNSASATKDKVKEIADKFANSQKAASKSSTTEQTPKSGFNFFSYLDNKDDANTSKDLLAVEDDKKTVVINSETISLEDLLDDICWKSNVYNLSTKYRYNILDGIDEKLPPELIIKKIEEEVQQYQKGFSA